MIVISVLVYVFGTRVQFGGARAHNAMQVGSWLVVVVVGSCGGFSGCGYVFVNVGDVVCVGVDVVSGVVVVCCFCDVFFFAVVGFHVVDCPRPCMCCGGLLCTVVNC